MLQMWPQLDMVPPYLLLLPYFLNMAATISGRVSFTGAKIKEHKVHY